jgi:hypothetical protein
MATPPGAASPLNQSLIQYQNVSGNKQGTLIINDDDAASALSVTVDTPTGDTTHKVIKVHQHATHQRLLNTDNSQDALGVGTDGSAVRRFDRDVQASKDAGVGTTVVGREKDCFSPFQKRVIAIACVIAVLGSVIAVLAVVYRPKN